MENVLGKVNHQLPVSWVGFFGSFGRVEPVAEMCDCHARGAWGLVESEALNRGSDFVGGRRVVVDVEWGNHGGDVVIGW